MAEWIGERAATVLAVHALRTGVGRCWLAGSPTAPAAALVESALVPGEPQAFGGGASVIELLHLADGWGCVEADGALAHELVAPGRRMWGLEPMVVDVVHELRRPVVVREHPLVRRLDATDLRGRCWAEPDLLPRADLVDAAAAAGTVAGAVDGGVLVGHGSSFAPGLTHADIGVHVAPSHRRQGIAGAAASVACAAVQVQGRAPVWGCGSENVASMTTAARLGFEEVERLVYLVRPSGGAAGPGGPRC